MRVRDEDLRVESDKQEVCLGEEGDEADTDEKKVFWGGIGTRTKLAWHKGIYYLTQSHHHSTNAAWQKPTTTLPPPPPYTLISLPSHSKNKKAGVVETLVAAESSQPHPLLAPPLLDQTVYPLSS
ncbi:uncharacterized protein RAG0_06372 [Rhynchosporium agropyri]|uniref:Uncharacterized protein n=1 Tax=Rhynchosporium agropyri TaxID=914238 RepID=A0A1E1KGS0_9HELO|nr:uncharacterized protein RAG0_06372 [Rhynchosporium agropyri]